MRPKLLKEAALKNNLFIHEDGSVIEIHEDAAEGKKKRGGKSPQKVTKTVKIKRIACGECEGCLKKACKNCDACKGKKRCSLRTCSNIKRIVISDDTKANGKKEDDSDDEEVEEGKESKTPRIRIRVGKSSSTKRKTSSKDKDDDDDAPESEGSQNASSRKRARQSNGRQSNRSPMDEEKLVQNDDDDMFDIENLQTKYEELSEASFTEARNNLMQYGPWRLPTALESNNASFKEVAKITLNNISQ